MIPSQPTTVIVKTTDSCNAACRYCYEVNAPVASTSTVSFGAIGALFNWVRDSGLAKVQIVWHGGEPLLAGRAFFREVFRLQALHVGALPEVVHSLQTNGALVDEEWIDLFKAGGIGVGISLDGPAWLHDAQRPLRSRRSSHAAALEAIHRMAKAELSVSLSAVVTRRSLSAPEEIISFFNGLPAQSVDFLPMAVLAERLNGHADLITSDEFSRFMLEVYKHWNVFDENRISVRCFENVVRGLTGRHPSLCTFSGRCGAYISIDHDGSVYPCDSFMRAPQLRLGQVPECSLGELLAGETYRRFRAEISPLPAECDSCEFRALCNGGCPSDRYADDGTFSRKYPFCHMRKQLAMRVCADLISAGAGALVHLGGVCTGLRSSGRTT